MMRIRYSKARQDYIDKQEALWLNRIRRSQSSLTNMVLQRFMPKLEHSAGRIKVTASNYALLGLLDTIFEEWLATEGLRLASYYIGRTDGLYSLNSNYARGVSGNPQNFAQIDQATKEAAYLALGYNIKSKKLVPGGPLSQIFGDMRPIQLLKQTATAQIAAGAPLEDANTALRVRGNGGEGQARGALEDHLNQAMHEPYQAFDRETSGHFATNLDLNYAIYQGGIIRDSRPFCRVRDNNVYSREEISRFGTPQDSYGGYTNKATGDFAGKCPKAGYNPFVHLGGCNCRHSLDWISDELAYELRPELRPAEGATP